MNIFFDIDYTLIAVDGSARPLISETISALHADGHIIYIWSGLGVRTREVKALGISHMVSGIYEKPLDRYRERLPRLGIEAWPDFVIDDYPEIVEYFGGMVIRTYMFANSLDREMEHVIQVIREFAKKGTSEDPAYRPANIS